VSDTHSHNLLATSALRDDPAFITMKHSILRKANAAAEKAREPAEKRPVVNSDDEDEDDLLFSGLGGSDDYTPPVDNGERDAHMEAKPCSSCVVSVSEAILLKQTAYGIFAQACWDHHKCQCQFLFCLPPNCRHAY
jgi:hypothetical protein